MTMRSVEGEVETTSTAAESPLHSSFNSSRASYSFYDNRSSRRIRRSSRDRRKRRHYGDDNVLVSSSSEDLTTKVVSRGVRDTNTPQTPCLAERQDRLRLVQSTRATEYVPNCRKDGSYAHVQCHPSTRSCWCVTRSGRPYPGSSVLSLDSSGPMQRPNCAKYNRRAKSQTRRRSSQLRKDRKCTRVNGSFSTSSCSVDGGGGDGDEDSSSDSDDLDDSDEEDDDVEYSDLCNFFYCFPFLLFWGYTIFFY